MTMTTPFLLIVAVALVSCRAQGNAGGSGSAAPNAAPKKIALLLPESKTTRYEAKDRPYFEAKVKAMCGGGCQVLVSNANQDAARQQAQAEAALTNGAAVIVLDAVDTASAAGIAMKAKAAAVPVIAYDRLIRDTPCVDDYVSFENESIGKLQGESLVRAFSNKPEPPRIVMINGAASDSNGRLFKKGAHEAIDGRLTVVREYDTPDWSPDKAQDEMTQALTALQNRVDGVYAANDGTAGGAIAAMKAAGVAPLPPVTGQDAELAAIQRIIAGEQYMTVYKPIKVEAETAAAIAYHLANGEAVPAELTAGKTVNNGKTNVPAVLLAATAVTRANVKDTIIADGFWTAAQVCTAPYESACKALGIF